ncbi:MAG: exodeoxyribonuclease VII large subunit, partial [Myxococcota bacterium]
YQKRAAQLRAEGLTDAHRKRALPPHPQCVGIVTSRTGAALRDVLRTIWRRDPAMRVRICHAQVQGARASGDLVSAIRCMARFGDCDVMIVARGGGSLEDLWAFNEMPVVEAISSCPIPVVVGVGHETDLTLCDMVADRSASTPTAAAELVAPDRRETKRRLEALQARLIRAADLCISKYRHRLTLHTGALTRTKPNIHRWSQQLDALHHRAEVAVRQQLDERRQQWTRLERRLQAAAPSARLAQTRSKLERLTAQLDYAMQSRLTQCATQQQALARRLAPAMQRTHDKATAQWQEKTARLEALSPLAVLQRGYALVKTDDGNIVRRATTLKPSDRVHIRLAEGEVEARILKTDARVATNDEPPRSS